MDMFGEASEASGSRVLTARHILPEKAPPVNNAINTTVLCHNLSIQPDFHSYYDALGPYAWALWVYGVLVFAVTCALFCLTLRAARKRWSECQSNLFIVLAVYPLVSASGLVVLVLPRARILAEAAAQQAVMVAMYQFFCMLLVEVGGGEKLIRKAGGSRLDTRVLPCCCWPCCVIPRPTLDQKTLSWMKAVVLQLPIVQGLIYVIMMVLWTEDMSLLARSFAYFQPFVICSILFGVWGIIMLVKAVEASGPIVRPRFLSVQLALIAVKAQCGVAKVLPELVVLPCVTHLNPAVLVHLIQYAIMMFEMLLLAWWARRLYSASAGNTLNPKKIVVAVLEDGTGEFKGDGCK